jgi:hypothetical protein
MWYGRRGAAARAALAGLVFGVAVGPPAARAQDAPTLVHVGVSLWPEYDRAAMLVICRASLAGAIQLPTVLTLPMPASAGTPHAVARLAANGTLLVADYTREVVGDVAWVRVATDSPDVQLEYYQDLGREGARRSFTYQWPAYTDVDAFSYEVQVPPGASEVTVVPPPERQDSGEGGRIFYYGGLGKLGKAAGATVQLSYARSAEGLSTVQANTPVATAGEPSAAGGVGPTWVWAVLAIAAVLFTMSIVVFLRSRKKAAG